MNVAGLNNQGFQAQATKASGGKAPQGKEKSSFGSILGEAQAQDKATKSPIQDSTSSSKEQNKEQKENPETPVYKQGANAQEHRETPPQSAAVETKGQVKGETKADPKADPKGDTKGEAVPNEAAADGEVSETSQGLPASQSAPAIGAPGLNDRLLSPAANQGIVNPMNAQAQGNRQDDSANSLTRRVVWNDFLRKMNDLGVSAEDVLHAFASLSEKDLAQPPEMSVDKVVAALGLNGQQAVVAKQCFQDLISKTKSKSFGEEMAASHKQLSLSLMSQREMQRKMMLKNIDTLDNNFFMNRPMSKDLVGEQPQMMIGEDGKPVPMPIVMPENAAQSMQALDTRSIPSEAAFAIPGAAAAIPQGVQTVATPVSAAAASTKGAAEMNSLVGQMQGLGEADKKSVDQLIKNFTSRQLASPESAMAASAPAAAAAAVTAPGAVVIPAAASAGAMAALGGIFSGGSDKGKDSSADDSGTDSKGQSAGLASALATAGRNSGADSVKGDFQSQMAKANGQPQMAVPELLSQAHIMVKDGGGEMKVTLHPDGLGEVAMRVSVTDGKVSVQMVTESDEAKKLIERQIGDLKNGLSQNHLQVDSIKVDTATNLGKQLEQQYHDAQRQQAQASLEQMRQEGGGGWRRSFFETGAVNPYQTQGQAARDTSAPAASARSASNSSRRLDLVA